MRGKTFLMTAISSAWPLFPRTLPLNFLTPVQYGGSGLNQPIPLPAPSDTAVSQKVYGKPQALPSIADLEHGRPQGPF